MDEQLRREIRRLRRTTAIAIALLVVVTASAFVQARQRAKFDEIDVERINVREPNGTLRLTISNHARLPQAVIGGKAYPLRGGSGVLSAGLIFFNDEGNEDGGLIWTGQHTATGNRAAANLTFDQFDQDETVSLGYGEDNRRRQAGLSIIDRPEESIAIFAESLMAIRALPDGPAKDARMRQFRDGLAARGILPANRLYVGKERDKSSTVTLSDPKGKPRLRLAVDSLGAARIEFLDDGGKITRTITGADVR